MEQTPQTQLTPQIRTGGGLTVRRQFTTEGVDPFDTVEWETRDAKIGHGDKISFEQRDVEFPRSWSQNATNIVAQKYFRGQPGSPIRCLFSTSDAADDPLLVVLGGCRIIKKYTSKHVTEIITILITE